MQPVETLNTAAEVSPPQRDQSSRRRWLRPTWVRPTLIGFTILVTFGFGFLILNWPFTKQAVIDALQQSSVKYVTIGHFYRTYFPPGCVSEDIRFLDGKGKDK